jgi:RHS repeat-associated protein
LESGNDYFGARLLQLQRRQVHDGLGGPSSEIWVPHLRDSLIVAKVEFFQEYDAFGNRKSQTPSGTGSAPQMNLPFTNPTNRVDPGNNIAYDAAGNVTTDNQGQTYTYDAEERISSMTHLGGAPTIYKYDSDGNLIYERGPDTAQFILRNLAGQPLQIVSPDGVPEPFWNGEAYVDGELLGDWNNGAFFFASTDNVGTKRFVSWGWGDLNTGTVPQFLESFTSLPFGDALSSIGSDPMHFTGKMRDVASGNDYFGARYYASSMGRWMSPDWAAKPEAVPYSSLDNPQSLNLYGYVGNNPLSKADRNGHCVEVISCTLEFAAAGSSLGPVGTGVGAALGAGIGIYIGYKAGQALGNYFHNQDAPAAPSNPSPATDATPVPTGLVGTDPTPTKGRTNSGPLAPENGGTGDAGKDFGTLTGGKSGPAPEGKGYPAGTQVGENGTQLRPGNSTSGPRIDIPANGSKPIETLHYPAPPPPPPKPVTP